MQSQFARLHLVSWLDEIKSNWKVFACQNGAKRITHRWRFHSKALLKKFSHRFIRLIFVHKPFTLHTHYTCRAMRLCMWKKNVAFKQMQTVLLRSLYLATKIRICGVKLFTQQFTTRSKCLLNLVSLSCQLPSDPKWDIYEWMNQLNIYFCNSIPRIFHSYVKIHRFLSSSFENWQLEMHNLNTNGLELNFKLEYFKPHSRECGITHAFAVQYSILIDFI